VGAELRRRVVGVGPRRGRWVRFRAGRAPFRGVRMGAIVADSAGVAQLVERQLPKLNVAGSSPVSRCSDRQARGKSKGSVRFARRPLALASPLQRKINQPRHGCRGGLGEKKTMSRVRVGHVCPTPRGWRHPLRRCLHGCSDGADLSAQPAARTTCRPDAEPRYCDRGPAWPARHPLAGAIEVAAAFP